MSSKADKDLNKRHIACVLCRKRKLKCDGMKPGCSHCTKLNQDCEYVDYHKKSGPKKGYVKALESRLAHMEQLLQKSGTNPNMSPSDQGQQSSASDDLFASGDMSSARSSTSSSLHAPHPSNPLNLDGFLKNQDNATSGFAREVISKDLDEPMPDFSVVLSLSEIYFDHDSTIPQFINRSRYMQDLNSTSTYLKPKPYLQYAIMLNAACLSEQHLYLQQTFYKRLRYYLEKFEMMADGQNIVNLQYVQACALMSFYEYRQAHFARAWMTIGRCVRACFMLNLHLIDMESVDHSSESLSEKISIDERRRTFWTAFCLDNYSSAGSGWPPIIDCRKIRTNVPGGAYPVQYGNENPVLYKYFDLVQHPEILMGQAMNDHLAFCTLFAGSLGTTFDLACMEKEPDDHLTTGAWWSKSRGLDSLLSTVLLVLPPVSKDMDESTMVNLVTKHVFFHTSIITLCRIIQFKIVEMGNKSPITETEVHARASQSASELVMLLRMVPDLCKLSVDPCITFSIYSAARCLINLLRSNFPKADRYKSHLDFLITILKLFRNKVFMADCFYDKLIADSIGITGNGFNPFKANIGNPFKNPSSFDNNVAGNTNNPEPNFSVLGNCEKGGQRDTNTRYYRNTNSEGTEPVNRYGTVPSFNSPESGDNRSVSSNSTSSSTSGLTFGATNSRHGNFQPAQQSFMPPNFDPKNANPILSNNSTSITPGSSNWSSPYENNPVTPNAAPIVQSPSVIIESLTEELNFDLFNSLNHANLPDVNIEWNSAMNFDEVVHILPSSHVIEGRSGQSPYTLC